MLLRITLWTSNVLFCTVKAPNIQTRVNLTAYEKAKISTLFFDLDLHDFISAQDAKKAENCRKGSSTVLVHAVRHAAGVETHVQR